MNRRIAAKTILIVSGMLSWAGLAAAQPIQVATLTGGIPTNIASGGTLPVSSPGLGQPSLSTITVRYAGSATATISAITLSGSTAITLASQPTIPISLSPGLATSFTLQYLPSSATAATATVVISYVENGGQTATFAFQVTASVSDVGFTYSVAPDGAVQNISPGDRITFPVTNAGSSSTVNVRVLNRGAGVAAVQSISLSGDVFQFSAPCPAAQLLSNQQLVCTLVYRPRSGGTNQGLLTITINGNALNFPITGTGTAPNYSLSFAFGDSNAQALTNGTAITFPPVDINANTTATIDVYNQGTGAGVLTAATVSGGPFRFSSLPVLPAAIPAGQHLRFGIVFTPPAGGTSSGSFRIELGDVTVSGALSGTTAPARLTLSYINPENNNIGQLADGSTLTIPNTLITANTVVTLVVTNTGAGTGFLNALALSTASPAALQLVNLPAFPASIPPNQQLRVGLRFSPQEIQTVTSSLIADLNGQQVTVKVQAQSTGPTFTYTFAVADGASATVVAGDRYAVPDTAVGTTTTVTVTITNSGTANGQITAAGVTGPGLSVSDVPPLPLTLRPSTTQSFGLKFSPTQPGPVTGRLTIGSDTFTITANAVGPQFTYKYTNSGGSPTTLVEGGTVIFAPTAIGKKETVDVIIENSGTQSATISSVDVTPANANFEITPPSLPMVLPAGETVSFSMSFAPARLGAQSGLLRVNSSTFNLFGSGTLPPPLPSYEFRGATGTLGPAQQPTISLTLASPYSLPLQGRLTLSFVSTVFSDDPAIQFATGGRTVAFTIPANSTQALFNGISSSIAFQTGTLAGNVVITPAFATTTGFDLTPTSPPPLVVTVPPLPPELLNGTVAAQTLNSFAILVNGYSTARSVRRLDIEIVPRQGNSVAAATFAVDVASAAAAWFQSANAQVFGGTFSIVVPFLLQRGNSTEDLVHKIDSIKIVAVNDTGSSKQIIVRIP
jgi:hypothetical protein